MQRFITHIAIPWLIACVVFPASAQDQETEEKRLKTTADELSYALGMDVGKSLKRFGAEIDFDIFMEAVHAILEGNETLLTSQQASKVAKDYALEKRKKLAAERKAAGERALVEGEAFLAENKSKEGVTTTDSGLQYQVIKEGDGAKPQATDKVTVHYRGTLLDGTEFDSSHTRGQPATFPVKGVIAGWTEALQLMPVGSTYKLFIPSKLAYGERGAGKKIGPNSTLIFEVELLEIAASESKKTAPASKADAAREIETPEASKER